MLAPIWSGFCRCVLRVILCCAAFFFFQAEDGIRDLVRSRGLGDVYKRQERDKVAALLAGEADANDTYIEINAGAGGTESQDLSLIHI
mgnify:CR=1 FL=1